MLTGTLGLHCGLETTRKLASWGLFSTKVTFQDRLSAPPGVGVDEKLLCQERKW